jgi:hypothetical protein
MKFKLKEFQKTSAKNILNELTESLPPEFQGSLASIEEIEAELTSNIATGGESWRGAGGGRQVPAWYPCRECGTSRCDERLF